MRWINKLKLQWFLISLLVILIWCSLLLKNPFINDSSDFAKTTIENVSLYTTEEKIREFTPKTFTKKYVTKSLKELGKMDDINKYFLFLNFIPKSGTEILIFLMERIQGLNNFKYVKLKEGATKYLEKIDQEKLVYQMYDIRKNEAIPLAFEKNVYFINFTEFARQSPTYLSLIRDPVEKVFAKFSEFKQCILTLEKENCSVQNPEKYDLSIPYFCGNNPRCIVLNDPWALKTAKRNVENFYPVVGILENLNSTLDILENKLPYFFKGTKRIYNKYLYGIYKQRKKAKIPQDIRNITEKILLKTEVQFYKWVKERLNLEAEKIIKNKEKNSL